MKLVLRLLGRRLGGVSPFHREQLERLSLGQLEDLGEALLDFKETNDLTQWLAQQK